ncbi:MAG: hypothetical protein ACE5OZ_00985 [Candidatus Heimdallarchaeota archaeon]
MSSAIVAYADQHHLEVLYVTGQSSGTSDFDQHFIVRRKGITEASFPCVAVEILVYVLEHLDALLARGLKPACSPTNRNTAMFMGSLWADFHLVDGIEGFTFYEDQQPLTFLSSRAIRTLNAFWQLQKPPEDGEEQKSCKNPNKEGPLAK